MERLRFRPHFFFFTLVTGPRRYLSLKLSDTRVYEPQIRARLGTTADLFRVVVLQLIPELPVHYDTPDREQATKQLLLQNNN